MGVFWPIRHGDSLQAHGGGIRSSFTGTGDKLHVARGTLGLSVAGVGRTGHLESLAAVTPASSKNEVLYRDGSLTAFYRNGPYGLEQGFTVQSHLLPAVDRSDCRWRSPAR